MKTIQLIRQIRKGIAVFGSIVFDFGPDAIMARTVENADYIIPAGEYPLEMTWSPKFKKFMPEIQNVPDREGIRIHSGTTPEHSTGCILLTPWANGYFREWMNIQTKINEQDIVLQIIDNYEQN